MTLVKANLEDLRSAASTLGEVATCVEDRHDALRNKTASLVISSTFPLEVLTVYVEGLRKRARFLRLKADWLEIWLELNKVGVGWCDWEVLEVVVEGAVGDVGGEGREGVLRGVALEVGDIVLGGVPHVFCGIVVGGVGGHVDGCDALQGPTGGV